MLKNREQKILAFLSPHAEGEKFGEFGSALCVILVLAVILPVVNQNSIFHLGSKWNHFTFPMFILVNNGCLLIFHPFFLCFFSITPLHPFSPALC